MTGVEHCKYENGDTNTGTCVLCSEYTFLEDCQNAGLTDDGILDCENVCGLQPEPIPDEEECTDENGEVIDCPEESADTETGGEETGEDTGDSTVVEEEEAATS